MRHNLKKSRKKFSGKKIMLNVVVRNWVVCFHRETNFSTERDQFFINRITQLWNNLPQTVKESKTLNSFKAGLDNLRSFSV